MWPFGPGDRGESQGDDERWAVIARFNAVVGDTSADLAVAQLCANGVPAIRLPRQPMAFGLASGLAAEAIRVLVPPDRLEQAREILPRKDAPEGR